MKKFLFISYFIILALCFSEQPKMNPILSNAMNRYFTDLIPKYYQGQRDFDDERVSMSIKNNFYMTGSGMHMFMDSNALIFNFYYLIEHRKQSVQVIMITSEMINNHLYEYWIVQLSDHGIPYNYSYFYLTLTDSKESKREILNVSKKYIDSYTVENGQIIDLTVQNLAIMYQIEPQEILESFAGTKYENTIVVWKTGEKPYLRKMNIFEKIYYKNLKKSKR